MVAESNTAARIEQRDGVIAPVIVSPYPDLLWLPSQGSCSSLATPLGDMLDDMVWRLDPQEIAFGRRLVVTFNDAQPLKDPVISSSDGGWLSTCVTTPVLGRQHTLNAQLRPTDDDGSAMAEGDKMQVRGGDSVTIPL